MLTCAALPILRAIAHTPRPCARESAISVSGAKSFENSHVSRLSEVTWPKSPQEFLF